MIDQIIIAVIGVALFFVIRKEVRRIGKAQCSCGCSGCPNNGSCSSKTKEAESKS